MAIVRSLRQVPGALGRNPIILAVLAAFGLLQAPQLLAQTIDPLLASVLSLGLSVVFVFIVPFVQAGLIGMVDEALDGRTEVGTFVSAGRAYYLPVLVAYLAIVALSFVLGVIGFVVGVLGGVSAAVGGVGILVLLVAGVVVVLGGLVYLVVVFFVQFYGQEIVLGGADAIEGLKGSVGLVRRNLLPTAGYTLVVAVVTGGLGGAVGVLSFLLQPDPGTAAAGGMAAAPTLSPMAAVVLAVAYALVSAVVGGFVLTFSVAFYREIRAPDPA